MSDRGTSEWWMKWRDNSERGTSGITLHLLSEKRREGKTNKEERRGREEHNEKESETDK